VRVVDVVGTETSCAAPVVLPQEVKL
jgi:hypothetical protein